MNIMDKLCAGCVIYEFIAPNKCKGTKNQDINCPCLKCLIKSMCRTPCNKFIDIENKWNNIDTRGSIPSPLES